MEEQRLLELLKLKRQFAKANHALSAPAAALTPHLKPDPAPSPTKALHGLRLAPAPRGGREGGAPRDDAMRRLEAASASASSSSDWALLSAERQQATPPPRVAASAS